MRNAEIAAALDELGDLYELDGAVVYRVVAYRQAARRSATPPARSRSSRATAGRPRCPNIGKTLQEKIYALVETGEIPQAVKLREKFPGELVRFIEIPGLGPKTARKIYDELGITTLDELRAAAETERLRSDLRAWARRPSRTSLRRSTGRRRGRRAERVPAVGGARRSATRSSSRCARIRPRTGSRSPAARAA